jgi:hypothetical protein
VELIGPYLAACGLLVVAGVAKSIRPEDTARALGDALAPRMSRRRLTAAVRIGSGAEALLGIVALGFPRPLPAALVALSYAAFAFVVAYARAKGGAIASCGCFGAPDTPATWAHVVVDAALAVSAATVAWTASTGDVWTLLSRQPLHGLPLVMASALAGWLAYLVMAVLASLKAARSLVGISFEPGLVDR